MHQWGFLGLLVGGPTIDRYYELKFRRLNESEKNQNELKRNIIFLNQILASLYDNYNYKD